MNLVMPSEVKDFLSRKEYDDLKDLPQNITEVVVSDPTYHIYR